MRYLECRVDKCGFGTYIKAQIKTNIFDYYIVYEGFDTSDLEPQKVISRNEFLTNVMNKLTEEDVILITCNDIQGLPGIETSKCIKILALHDVTPLRVKYLSRRKKKCWREKVRQAIECCNYITTVSNFSKNDIQSEFSVPEECIFVVYNYAQNVAGKLNQKDIYLLQNEIGQNTKYIISTVGSLNPNKNLYRVIRAWKKCCYYNDSVLIATSKKNTLIFKIFLTLLGVRKKVIVPGYVPIERLASIYHISHLYIFTTLREGFGLPPIEAMSVGTPVLTSNTSCMEEILSDSAIFINPYSIEAISKGVENILADNVLSKKLINKGKVQAAIYSEDRFYSEMMCMLHCVEKRSRCNNE